MIEPLLDSQHSRECIYVKICGGLLRGPVGGWLKWLGSRSRTVTVTVAIRSFEISVTRAVTH